MDVCGSSVLMQGFSKRVLGGLWQIFIFKLFIFRNIFRMIKVYRKNIKKYSLLISLQVYTSNNILIMGRKNTIQIVRIFHYSNHLKASYFILHIICFSHTV